MQCLCYIYGFLIENRDLKDFQQCRKLRNSKPRVSSVDGPSECLNYCNFWGHSRVSPAVGGESIPPDHAHHVHHVHFSPPFTLLLFLSIRSTRDITVTLYIYHSSLLDGRYLYLQHMRVCSIYTSLSAYFAALLPTTEIYACFPFRLFQT